MVFLFVPALGVFYWSLFSGGIARTEFVGLENFIKLPSNIEAADATFNTFGFALMSIPPTILLALGLALLLARVRRGAAVYRFLLYFPVLVPGVVAGLIWIYLTHKDFGLFNQVLRLLGLPAQTWLGNDTALPVLAMLDVWRSVGYWAIFLLAAIIALPKELNQAAALDGAGPSQRFRFVTLPQLRPILLFVLVVATIFGLQVFDTALILTRGGPGTATTTIVYKIWTYAFSAANMGMAAAISVVLLLAILGLTSIQMRLLRERRHGG